jgi:TRAP-type C4-dicarboxylate transport system permease small subunit
MSAPERVSAWLARAGGALMLASALLITLDVLFRNLFRLTIFESFEITTYAFAVAVSAGFAYALHAKAHIRIEVAYLLAPSGLRLAFDLLAAVGIAVTAMVLLWFAVPVVLGNLQTGARSNSALSVPMAIPQGLWLCGIVWFALSALWLLGQAVAALRLGRRDRFNYLVGIPRLEEEIEASVEPPAGRG